MIEVKNHAQITLNNDDQKEWMNGKSKWGELSVQLYVGEHI